MPFYGNIKTLLITVYKIYTFLDKIAQHHARAAAGKAAAPADSTAAKHGRVLAEEVMCTQAIR